MASTVQMAPVAPRPPPSESQSLRGRWQQTWFPSPALGALSVLLLVALAWVGWRFLQWGLLQAHWRRSSSEACPRESGACWAFVIARWKPWLVANYPTAEVW